LREARTRRRNSFLERMSKEAIASYDDPYKEWYEDEREYLKVFLSLVGERRRILDLAGGYAKAAPVLVGKDNSVVLADMSRQSLRDGRTALADSDVQFIRADMLRDLPFVDSAFDGIWFAEAFEYVPPDKRMDFLKALRRVVRDGGTVFLSAEGLDKNTTRLTYLKNYLYWRLVKREPVVWGEYIYMLDLPKYKGWHYHALTFRGWLEKRLRAAGFEILKSKSGESEYTLYILRAI
jgi:ubiquinone/menaquinone biosynthesis C-methylase UbiE